MPKYRMTIGESFQRDIEANNMDDAMNRAIGIAIRSGYRNSGKSVFVQEIKDGIKEIGIEFEAYDRVFKESFRNYLFIMANNEREAIDLYNKQYKGKHFWFNAMKPEADGKNEYGKVIRTYYC